MLVYFLIAFVILYPSFLAYRLLKDQIDLYDFLMLSSVALAPFLFKVFEPRVEALTRTIGVGFPFLILFGLLFAVTFFMLHYLIVSVRRLKRNNITLVQELGLLRLEGQHGPRTPLQPLLPADGQHTG